MAVTATPPPAIVRIAEQTRRSERGIVGYRLHRVFDVHAGPFGRHDEFELAVISVDGKTDSVRVLRYTIGGRQADDKARAALKSQYEHPNPQDLFARPFDSAYLAEYRFEQIDPRTFRFVPFTRDSRHGEGRFSVDADGNVVSMTYTPGVMPQHASSGSITIARAQVLPKYWMQTRETHEYRGRYAIFSGSATVSIEASGFTSFADVASARAALDAGRI